MIQIIPCSEPKVHHEVAADRSTASLPSTAQFGRSAPNLSKENDRTMAGLFGSAFLFQDAVEHRFQGIEIWFGELDLFPSFSITPLTPL